MRSWTNKFEPEGANRQILNQSQALREVRWVIAGVFVPNSPAEESTFPAPLAVPESNNVVERSGHRSCNSVNHFRIVLDL
jgi:hypothetical protein